MKNTLRFLTVLSLVVGFTSLSAQTRYQDEVFSDAEIDVVTNVVFGTNIDFLTSNLTPSAQLATDIGTLSAIADAGGAYPAAYLNPGDASTQLKVTNVAMDVYYPSASADTETERPLIVYLHTGNFLPPPINGSMMGDKSDSLAVDFCKAWARRGYVAVSMNYRLGWNPIAPDVQTRRGTLLNAVYRAIQDTKEGVRFLKEDAAGENTYGINPDKIALFGEGSGGYMSLAYVTLDNPGEELFLEKFRPNPFDETVSYIDTLVVGPPSGIGFPNSLNLYRDNGFDTEVHMSVNLGGALADESWLEDGDVPMVSFHAIRDDFAPFTFGTVIVPTTQEEVVDVHGSNFVLQKANDLGNNDVFAGLPDGDVYTDRARGLYGSMWDVSNAGTETVNNTPEGLFPIVQPLRPFLTNISAPWQWWDPNAPLSQVEVAPGVTTNLAQLQSNPNMSEAQSIAFQDTINGYLLPRLTCALELPGNPCTVLDPCPAPTAVVCDNIDSYDLGSIEGQAAHWAPWPGGTVVATVTGEQAFSNLQSLKVGPGGVEDNLLLLNDETTGNWTISWKMYVPSGATGYFNIQANPTIGSAFIYQCYLNEGGAAPGVGNFQQLTETFTYPEDEWFDVLITVNLNDAVHSLSIDGNVVLTDAPYVSNAGAGVATGLSAINFYSVDDDNTYYLDDVIYDGDPAVGLPEYVEGNFRIYPNPNGGLFTIEGQENIEAVVVRNVIGATVAQLQTNFSNRVEMDLTGLDNGLYFVEIMVDDVINVQRLIKE